MIRFCGLLGQVGISGSIWAFSPILAIYQYQRGFMKFFCTYIYGMFRMEEREKRNYKLWKTIYLRKRKLTFKNKNSIFFSISPLIQVSNFICFLYLESFFLLGLFYKLIIKINLFHIMGIGMFLIKKQVNHQFWLVVLFTRDFFVRKMKMMWHPRKPVIPFTV